MIKAEEIYKKLEESAKNCPFCGRKEHVRSVRIGNGDEIVAEFECRNAECKFHIYSLRSYRRMLPSAAVEIKELMTEEEYQDAIRKAGAAMDAEIKCPECGEIMRYIETDLLRNGKLVHELACQNTRCFKKHRIFIELSDEDCEKIKARRKAQYVCGICGATDAMSWVHCPKYGGLVCEHHCGQCEEQHNETSLPQCLYGSYAESQEKEAEKARKYLGKALGKV